MNRLPILLVLAAGFAAALAGDEAVTPPSPADTSAAESAARSAESSRSPEQPAEGSEQTPEKHLFTGQVVLLRDALKKRNIKSYEDELKGQVVLDSDNGELIPILPDWRGRAFYQDEQLRNRKVELVGFRHPGVPYLNVLMVFAFDETGERQYTDYWCDICSIPMYEIKQCECCQGPIHLRYTQRDLPDYIQQKPASAGQ